MDTCLYNQAFRSVLGIELQTTVTTDTTREKTNQNKDRQTEIWKERKTLTEHKKHTHTNKIHKNTESEDIICKKKTTKIKGALTKQYGTNKQTNNK